MCFCVHVCVFVCNGEKQCCLLRNNMLVISGKHRNITIKQISKRNSINLYCMLISTSLRLYSFYTVFSDLLMDMFWILMQLTWYIWTLLRQLSICFPFIYRQTNIFKGRQRQKQFFLSLPIFLSLSLSLFHIQYTRLPLPYKMETEFGLFSGSYRTCQAASFYSCYANKLHENRSKCSSCHPLVFILTTVSEQATHSLFLQAAYYDLQLRFKCPLAASILLWPMDTFHGCSPFASDENAFNSLYL